MCQSGDTKYKTLEDLMLRGSKSAHFDSILADVVALSRDLSLERSQVDNYLENLWLPIALNLAAKRGNLKRTLIQGILGGQGTGKTTFCTILKVILKRLGYAVATLSIDDLYLTYAERQALKQQDPRLIWRGPPGTHDITLGLQIIDRCLQSDDAEILMPRFDKSAFNGAGDRSTPEAITKPDILLFEGWFVGVQPITEDCFEHPPTPIITLEDIQFARDNNQRLQAYLPLWNKLDALIILYPEDYRLSKQWRKEAEHKTIARGKAGMSDEEIDRFVEYFWQALHPELFIEPLIKTADLVVKIKSDRTLAKIHRY